MSVPEVSLIYCLYAYEGRDMEEHATVHQSYETSLGIVLNFAFRLLL